MKKHSRLLVFFTLALMLCAVSCSTDQRAAVQQKIAKANASYQQKTGITIGQSLGLIGSVWLDYQRLAEENAAAVAAAASSPAGAAALISAKDAMDVLP